MQRCAGANHWIYECPEKTCKKVKSTGADGGAAQPGGNASLGPKSQQGRQPTSTLFVGNLSWKVTDEQLTSHFEGVTSVRLPVDHQSNKPKGFGYVEFETVELAVAAYDTQRGSELMGQ